MTAFSTDDYYNVLAEHVIEALQADTKLDDAGALDVALWELEFREHAGLYNANELPVVAVTVDGAGESTEQIGSIRRSYEVSIWVVTDGGRKDETEKTVKAFAARIERVMGQQGDPTKQLADVPTDLLEAQAGSVIVTHTSTEIGGGAVEGNLRGAAVLGFGVTVDFTLVFD